MKFKRNKHGEKVLGHAYLNAEQIGSFEVEGLPYTQVIFKLPSGVYFNGNGEVLEVEE